MKTIPIETRHLFAELDDLLIACLRSCTAEDWNRRTIAPLWTVRDVASHLLDGNLRLLSIIRDRHFGESPGELDGYQGLVNYLNQLNADWVKATRRLSPRTLTDLLATTGAEASAIYASMDPWEEAVFSVSWAGEEKSINWFHIAREYTEKWHHQQQIRETLLQTAPLMQSRFYRPLIHTFLMGMPHTYRNVEAAENTSIETVILELEKGTWYLNRVNGNWQLDEQPVTAVIAKASIPAAIAWKLFTKGLSAEAARKHIRLKGEEKLLEPIVHLVAVMA